MNSNTTTSSITITTKTGRTLIVEGLGEYKYTEDGLIVLLTKDLKSGIYIAEAIRKTEAGRFIESPFVLADDIDSAIDKVKDALEWQSNRIPVLGAETDLHMVSCEIDKDYTVYVYEKGPENPATHRYMGYVKWMEGDKVRQMTDMVYGETPDQVFDRAYESVQRQKYAYAGWYK